MKKQGFSLVELLAVVAIMAVLIIIVLPNVVELYNDSKKNTFLIEVKSIFNSANVSYMKQSMQEADGIVFYRLKGDENAVPLSGRQLYYYVKVRRTGDIVEILVWDGTNTKKKKDINGIKIAELSEDDIVTNIDTSNLTLNDIKNLFN